MIRRILLVIDSLFPLGDAYQMKILAEGLVARQHKVELCVLGSGDDSQRESESAFFRQLDIPVHFLSSGQKLKHRIHAAKIQTGLRLRKRIRAFGPDLVHAFGQPSTHIAAAVLLKDNKTKLFSSVLSRWKPHTTPTRRFEGCLVNRVDRFIAAHECLENGLDLFDVDQEKFSVINNGIESTHPQQQPPKQQRELLIEATGIAPSAFIATTSADLEPVTRLKDLIWATDLLTCVRDDVHLVIFGKGAQHQRLVEFAACTEAASHIHFAGVPPMANEMLGGADVYWNSHLQTPQPSALLAAMNFGVPVISVYGPETEQIVRHQETGFAVNFGARDEFARWTKFLIEKPDAAKQLARQGQSHVQDLFDSQRLVSSIENLFAE